MKKLLLIFFLLFFYPISLQGETKKISGTTNVEDAYINVGVSNRNYGGSTLLRVQTIAAAYQYDLIRVKNVASELGAGATNITAVCSLYCYNSTEDDNIGAYRVFKPWEEGNLDGGNPGEGDGCTWLDWYADSKEWADPGCLCANDDGVDNSTDNDDCDASTKRDRKATAEDAVNVISTGWYSWDISTELATGWYNGTIEEEGIILVGSTDFGVNLFYSTEYTTDPTKCPFFVFTYTAGVAGVDKPRKNIMSGGIVK